MFCYTRIVTVPMQSSCRPPGVAPVLDTVAMKKEKNERRDGNNINI
jgi:hypothetical protein